MEVLAFLFFFIGAIVGGKNIEHELRDECTPPDVSKTDFD